ncbi:MAG: hypothetical protein Q4D41_12855 [Prevotellaceae bacterium]|nr:hypothetical protein [Prevotellaceae bacterium]
MEATIRHIIIALLLIPFQANGMTTQEKVKIEWNKTDRILPSNVQDSIIAFYNSIDKDGSVFVLSGNGINEDKSNTDGIYTFKALISHDPVRMLIIYNHDVSIVRSTHPMGVAAEVCRYAKAKGIDDNFFKEICKSCFNYFVDDYQTVELINGKYNKVYFPNKEESLDYMIKNSNIELVYNTYNELKSKDNIKDELLYSILIKELNKEETILLLGLIGDEELVDHKK